MKIMSKRRIRKNVGNSCFYRMFTFFRGRPSTTLLLIVCLAAFWQVIYLIVSYHEDDETCRGLHYQQFLCAKYLSGEIVGDLCDQLCSEHIQLSKCLESEGSVQVFYTWRHLLKVSKHQLRSFLKDSILENESLFFKPVEAASLQGFYGDLAQFFEMKLGPGVHDHLIMRAVKMVDHNKDGTLSLAEAKTLWSLLQNNEFFILAIFSNEFNIPPIKGFCGNLYALNHPHTQYLYNDRGGGVVRSLFPNSYSWMFPAWEKRAKIVYSTVELVYNLLEERYGAMFAVCNWDETNVGYSTTHEVQITDYSFVVPQHELSVIQSEKRCYSNEDCQYGRYCPTVCNKTTSTCTSVLERSVFAHLCSIIKQYLLKNVPDEVKVRLVKLLDRCVTLKGDDYVHQSLFANDILTLLWPKILHLNS